MRVTTEPVMGWRGWFATRRKSGVMLRSVTYDQHWPALKPLQGSCHQENVVHFNRGDCPTTVCVCGIYAFKDDDYVKPWVWAGSGTRVIGRVSLWGRVLEHDRGYRAQYAYPYELMIPDYGDRTDQLARDLRAKYRVDVTMLTNRPTSTNVKLSREPSLA